MKVLNLIQIKEWDKYTIENEPITSIKLMERAATACVKWIEKEKFNFNKVAIFCGQGNNGGDGLVVARLLASKFSEEGMIAGDIANYIGDAFKKIKRIS